MRYLFLIFLSISLYADNIELNLRQFAELVSSQNRVNIIVDNEIQSNNFSFYLQSNKNSVLLPAFRRMLELKKLVLVYDSKNHFYYIHEKKEYRKTIHTVKLKSLSFEDIKPILEQYKDLKYSYLSNTNTIVLVCSSVQFRQLSKLIKLNDVIPKQFQVKITIVETNLNDSKERGIQISSYSQKQQGNFQYFIDLFTNSSSVASTVFNGSQFGFNAALRYLDDIGVSKVKSSPFMLVQSGSKISFDAVENVPYLTSSSTVKGASESKSQSVQYKDVGLKINLLPRVVNDIVYVSLDFAMESFIDKSSLTPTSSKRSLVNDFQLKKGQLLVLSGFQQVESSTSTIGIPILMKIPFLGQMFSYDRDIHTNKSLSIVIEIL